jgi:hypothetical protein
MCLNNCDIKAPDPEKIVRQLGEIAQAGYLVDEADLDGYHPGTFIQ